MEIRIRSAQAADIEMLLEFEKSVIETERSFDNTLKEGEIYYYNLIELIGSPKAEVLLAMSNDEIVGSGYAKILQAKPYQKFQEYAYLGFMYIKPAFRGRGINQNLIQHLIEWAKNKEITEVKLEVYSENIAAQKAYLKLGFKPNMLEMRLDVS